MRDAELFAEVADIGASLLGLDPKRDGYAEERRRLEARLNLLAMHAAEQRRKEAERERAR